MKTVIDTNVVISGLFWKGPPADILASWLARKFEWVVSADILSEHHRTLQSLETKYPPPASAWGFLRGLSLSATITTPAELDKQVCADPNDDKFIAAAIGGHANTIVTGDKALLKTDGYSNLQVIRPAKFLKMLQR